MSYTIKQAAVMSGLSEYTLRYYDKEGLLPSLGRTKSGNRCFDDRDIEWISFVNCLKGTGMSIKQIKKYTELCKQGDETLHERLQIFLDQRENVLAMIQELNRNLEKVNHKIKIYTDECAVYDAKRRVTVGRMAK